MLGVSRTSAAELATSGAVRVNGAAVGKSERLEAGAWLEVEVPKPAAVAAPQPVPGLTIVREDDAIIVVDKPVGVAAHPSPGWDGPTVVGGLLAAGHTVAAVGAAERQGIVHRLDVGTSGLMVVAKTDAAYSDLKEQFRQREVTKTYHALVQGHPDPLRGTIDAPIGRLRGADHRFGVVADGRPSITRYDTLEAFRYATLLTIRLETGRTHQIRVHMSATRHPCVGDITYGADPVLAHRLRLTRQWLHAVELSFRHPVTDETVTVTSPYPADLADALVRLAE
jgi:23S rRNA pseudouridine1911/1915/1917 synthase